MKNIHVLPTDKPTRLFTSDSELILAGYPATTFKTGKNIYITSDEEIKEGDWYFDGTDLVHKKTKYNDALVDGNEDAKKIILTTDQELIKDSVQAIDGELCFYIEAKDGKRSFAQRTYQTLDRNKKIILTTDQDLIKDGVQAIDDEFLEWFVKNPNCEEVDVFKEKQHIGEEVDESYPKGFFDYKIIIPKEEPKQTDEKGKPMTYWGGLEKSKQEATPEEVAEYLGFVKGVKWQQEQDENKYSEEDMRKAIDFMPYHLEYGNIVARKSDKDIENFIEQFKKK